MVETTLTNRNVVKRDVWIGVIIVCLGILLFTQINSEEAIHRTLPEYVFSFIILLGIIISLTTLKGKKLPNLRTLNISILEISYFIVILLGLFSIQHIGFYISSVILVFILFLMSSKAYDKNTLIKSGSYSLLLTIFMFVIFDIVLGISLPKGILF